MTMSAVSTKQEILRRIQRHREEIRALGVEGLGLFGSFVRGEQGPQSDVDLLVRFRPQEKSFDNFMGLAFLLEDILERRVELVTTEGLSRIWGSALSKRFRMSVSTHNISARPLKPYRYKAWGFNPTSYIHLARC
jgi:predicted nucleotidyltransferase